MLAATFLDQGAESLRNPFTAAQAAQPTLDGLQKLPAPVAGHVPGDPETLARLTAAAQIGGGLLLATGRLPRVAAAILAASVIPANLGSHMFWREPDSGRRAAQRRALLLDVSLLGALLIAAADTAGQPSLGWRGRRAARALGRNVHDVTEAAARRGADGAAAAAAVATDRVRRLAPH